jgi:hypothetical protein
MIAGVGGGRIKPPHPHILAPCELIDSFAWQPYVPRPYPLSSTQFAKRLHTFDRYRCVWCPLFSALSERRPFAAKRVVGNACRPDLNHSHSESDSSPAAADHGFQQSATTAVRSCSHRDNIPVRPKEHTDVQSTTYWSQCRTDPRCLPAIPFTSTPRTAEPANSPLCPAAH